MATSDAPRRVFIPTDLAQHNSRGDCWVAVFGKVLNLSGLIASLPADQAALGDPLIDAAGTDISSWFDPDTGDVRTRVDPVTFQTVPYLPMGRFAHVALPDGSPLPSMPPPPATPWWRDSSLVVGTLSRRVRKAWVVNTLTEQRQLLSFGAEETVQEMQGRFLEFNKHCRSYTWKVLLVSPEGKSEFRPLETGLTLAENGCEDTTEELETLGLDPDEHLPVIHLYFNDDLTEA
jgi:hypothetical protein